jgi:hypothetical protein
MRKHEHLAAVMRLVREHVREHRSTRRPNGCPAAAQVFFHAAVWRTGKCVREHGQALPRALAMRPRRLLHRAAAGIERLRAFQVRSGIANPNQPAVVQVRKNRRDGASLASGMPGKGSAPGARIEALQDELVHRIVDGIYGQDCVDHVPGRRRSPLACLFAGHESPLLRGYLGLPRRARPSCPHVPFELFAPNCRLVICSICIIRSTASRWPEQANL